MKTLMFKVSTERKSDAEIILCVFCYKKRDIITEKFFQSPYNKTIRSRENFKSGGCLYEELYL